MSRHRGAKLRRRYGLSTEISLLSLAYLLSVKQRPFHTASLDHYSRPIIPVRHVCLTVKQAYAIARPSSFSTTTSLPYAQLRYSLGAHRPSETTTLQLSVKRFLLLHVIPAHAACHSSTSVLRFHKTILN